MKKQAADIALATNNATYIDYMDRLRMLATSIFSWKNLDKIMGYGAERFLEKILYEDGRACFVDDKELGLMVLHVNPSDKLNIYGLPDMVQAWSIGYHKNYNFNDVIYILNNHLEKPTSFTINLIAYRLYETERTIDVNLMAQKTPVLIEGDTKAILSLKQVYEQYSGNIPFIFGNKNFDISNKLSSIKTEAPYLVTELTQHKKDLVSEALNYLGIDNFFSDKKERLVTGEVEKTSYLTDYYLNCFFKTRAESCEMLNQWIDKKNEDRDEENKLPHIELTINRDQIKKLKDELDDIISEGENNE